MSITRQPRSGTPRLQRPNPRTVAKQRHAVRLVRTDYERMKRFLDIIACLAVLPFVVLLMACCAAALWIDNPGLLFFRQWRTGRGGRRFQMLKFRTMVANAEELKETYAHLNELTWPDFKITNDPRVTRVGRFLRRTSLDELPQLYNVLAGHMSLVGPRPTSFDVNTYSLSQTERLEVMPGITGLWQVSGRSKIDFDERVRLDVEYIEKRSLWFDMRLILQTVLAVSTQKGAC